MLYKLGSYVTWIGVGGLGERKIFQNAHLFTKFSRSDDEFHSVQTSFKMSKIIEQSKSKNEKKKRRYFKTLISHFYTEDIFIQTRNWLVIG